MATILLIDSAAPEAVRRTVRRGISTRRPVTDGRPAIPGPDVGMIASQVSGDGQDNYQEQRRRNQEQGAELHEVSLGRMQNTRVNNNVRLGTFQQLWRHFLKLDNSHHQLLVAFCQNL